MINFGLIMPLSTVYVDTNPYYEIMIVFSIGILIAAFYALYNKAVLGKFVRALINAEAESESSAKTLDEIGYGLNKLITQSLRTNITFKRYIKKSNNMYYISAEDKEMMAKRFDNKNTDARAIFLTIVLLVVTLLFLWFVIPSLLNYVYDTFS
ncbi:MAG: hypothetical protein A2Y17_08970 [Clostridiales bacterium GWF2_38_85]|nr:MAG: hypothetical protein A2Y17_08970 [Clostridiales bacterium GWF2_38_85]HBL83672.1 hypothetical protein [Clostridiales bacterium]